MAEISRSEGLTLRRLKHGGYLVTHPDIYAVKALYFGASTIEEAFAFMKTLLDVPPLDPPTTTT